MIKLLKNTLNSLIICLAIIGMWMLMAFILEKVGIYSIVKNVFGDITNYPKDLYYFAFFIFGLLNVGYLKMECKF